MSLVVEKLEKLKEVKVQTILLVANSGVSLTFCTRKLVEFLISSPNSSCRNTTIWRYTDLDICDRIVEVLEITIIDFAHSRDWEHVILDTFSDFEHSNDGLAHDGEEIAFALYLTLILGILKVVAADISPNTLDNLAACELAAANDSCQWCRDANVPAIRVGAGFLSAALALLL